MGEKDTGSSSGVERRDEARGTGVIEMFLKERGNYCRLRKLAKTRCGGRKKDFGPKREN